MELSYTEHFGDVLAQGQVEQVVNILKAIADLVEKGEVVNILQDNVFPPELYFKITNARDIVIFCDKLNETQSKLSRELIHYAN